MQTTRVPRPHRAPPPRISRAQEVFDSDATSPRATPLHPQGMRRSKRSRRKVPRTPRRRQHLGCLHPVAAAQPHSHQSADKQASPSSMSITHSTHARSRAPTPFRDQRSNPPVHHNPHFSPCTRTLGAPLSLPPFFVEQNSRAGRSSPERAEGTHAREGIRRVAAAVRVRDSAAHPARMAWRCISDAEESFLHGARGRRCSRS